MKNKLIFSIFLINLMNILNKHTLLTLIIFNFYFLDKSLEVPETDFSVFVYQILIKLREYIIENYVTFILYISFFILIFVLVISVLFIIFSLKKIRFKKTKNFQEKSLEIRNNFKIPLWIKIEISLQDSYCILNKLYISAKGFSSLKNKASIFFIYHELAHLRSFDSILNIIEKSYAILLTIFASGYLSGFIELYINLSDSVLSSLVAIILFCFLFLFVLHIEYIPTRYKEHICDFYALRKSKLTRFDIQKVFDSGSFIHSLSHPSGKQRLKYIENKKNFIFLKIFLYNFLYIILLYYFSQDSHQYLKNITFFIISFSISINLVLIKCNY